MAESIALIAFQLKEESFVGAAGCARRNDVFVLTDRGRTQLGRECCPRGNCVASELGRKHEVGQIKIVSHCILERVYQGKAEKMESYWNDIRAGYARMCAVLGLEVSWRRWSRMNCFLMASWCRKISCASRNMLMSVA